ncbi:MULTISPECIES: PEP-CTERM sorting domain-containing protein [unclassified Microcystis]|uniref:PEP-CTERM sorting domain-containing protein n=1 Tax=unclassified Microcystis TaxID=2643300 RepID=UPI00257F01BA|nr:MULTISPECIES: PEP-CTERM sorting domain-containing protein [unclassified Microcystis]
MKIKTSTAIKKLSTATAFAAISACSLVISKVEAAIMQVAPGTLTGTGLITFDDVAGGTAPGTNYNAIFESNGADFAERFVGQSLSFSGDSDILSGLPTGPLALQVGAANQNLNVWTYNTSQVLTGLGPKGFPGFDAIGEGSFAVLFDFDQSEFGFDLIGGDGGSATVNFFKRDGSLIDTITLSGLANTSYAFKQTSGIKEIAGISIYNTDPAGIGFDNLIHDVPREKVPEPASVLGLLALGALGAGSIIKRKLK